MQIETRPTVTDADRRRLLKLIASMRDSGPPYEGFVAELEQVLLSAETTDAESVDPQLVTLDSRIRLRDLARNTAEEVTLVERSDSAGLDGRVSVLSPLGLRLLGARAGDVIEWRFRWGVVPLQVEQVLQAEPVGHRETHM